MESSYTFFQPELASMPNEFLPASVFISKRAKIHSRLAYFARIFAIIGILFITLPFLATKVSEAISARSTESLYEVSLSMKAANSAQVESNKPAFDSSLPTEPRILINKIGVDTQIRQLPIERYEEALEDGAWMPLDFGTPASDGPVIVAAHRFGYLKWTNDYRRKHSFFNLPKLENGDRVEVIWHQRKYEYEIYKTENGTEITDYDADLILFTCNDLVSDMRIVVYGKRV